MPAISRELDYSQPRLVAFLPPEFPFEEYGDFKSIIVVETYKQTRAGFIQDMLASRYVPGKATHPTYREAYLITTTKPQVTATGLYQFDRTWARIPSTQTIFPGSRYVVKPDYNPETTNPFDPSGGVDSGAAITFSPYASSGRAFLTAGTGIYTSGDGRFYTGLKSNGGSAIVITRGYATAGTFTLTYKASTTGAIAFGASSATIESALNALASVVADGLVFHAVNFLNAAATGTLSISLISGTTTTAVTLDATGLTVNTSKNPITSIESSFQQTIRLPSHLTLTGHGFNTANALAVLWDGEGYTYATTQWGSIDADTIWAPNRGTNVINAYYAATYDTTYTPPTPDPGDSYAGGWRLTRVRQLLYFYLPGVSPGITTLDDIDPPAGLQNPDDFLAALLAGTTGYQTFQSDGPAVWHGPIYMVTVTQYNFDDLV